MAPPAWRILALRRLVALSRPKELADRLEAYRAELSRPWGRKKPIGMDRSGTLP
ncbi:MAG TPA: hypothetical protein VE265_02195 [Actinomycetota bacterium]|nr:hypothetical protein [Actinomycetota bacterium]